MYLPDKLEGFVTTDKNPDPRSIDGLIAWLETQSSQTEYPWYSTRYCMFCRYIEAMEGKSWHEWSRELGGGTMSATLGEYIYHQDGAYHAIGAPQPWTYGAALTRAKAHKMAHGL